MMYYSDDFVHTLFSACTSLELDGRDVETWGIAGVLLRLEEDDFHQPSVQVNIALRGGF